MQADLSKFEVSLVLKTRFRKVGVVTESNPVFKNKNIDIDKDVYIYTIKNVEHCG